MITIYFERNFVDGTDFTKPPQSLCSMLKYPLTVDNDDISLLCLGSGLYVMKTKFRTITTRIVFSELAKNLLKESEK